jgi:hypothetical protein
VSETHHAGEFFIVDNSDGHWKALEYVRQWSEISSAIDIATGHFEIGAFLARDGEWQKVDKIRLLIGGEATSTRDAAIQWRFYSLARVPVVFDRGHASRRRDRGAPVIPTPHTADRGWGLVADHLVE